MSFTTRGRVVVSNQAVLDQADFFQLDGYTRVFGLTISDLVSSLFHDNELQPWPLVSGVGVTNAQVVSGKIYFNELSVPGVYGIRFRPNAVGYWRMLLDYPAGTQIVAQDYDVTPTPETLSGGGLKTSFIKPAC